jgi:uncharacterized membrane-anchored protein
MKKKILGLMWGVAVVAQLGVVASMINTQETILREGMTYRFRTAPVDPYDAFRGRYVAIALEPRTVLWPEGEATLKAKETFYVTLSTNADGYAVLTGASTARPAEGDYLRVKRGWRAASNQVGVVYGVDRYYLPENEAPRAEQLYREHSRRGQQEAFVVLKVRKGESVAEDLVVGDRSIRAWLKDAPE